jgi:hypothetical protein
MYSNINVDQLQQTCAAHLNKSVVQPHVDIHCIYYSYSPIASRDR